MLKRLVPLRSSDSPFRYRQNVSLSPHLRTKRFNEDVVLFASPEKLFALASDALNGSLVKDPSKAFWEILAKRFNASLHLMEGFMIVRVMDAFDRVSDRADLMSGLCHFVSEEVQRSRDITMKFSSVDDLLRLSTLIGLYSNQINPLCYEKLLLGFAHLSYQINSKDTGIAVLECLTKLKRSNSRISDLESILVKRISRRVGDSDLRKEHVPQFSNMTANS